MGATTMLQSLVTTFWPVGLVVFASFMLEWLLPWRSDSADKLRWLHACVLYAIGIIGTYFIVPLGSADFAIFAQTKGWGLLNFVGVPIWLAVLIGIPLLDFMQWSCHWLFHKSPVFWRVHRLHHSDKALDTSTAFRFHPIETLLRFLVQAVAIITFGIPVQAIAIYIILAMVFTVWEHANAKAFRFTQPLSLVLVTPELHRIHHGENIQHQTSNLGTVFSLWDRIFGTFTSGAEARVDFKFGLGPSSELSFKTLTDLVIDPFRRD
jgi:sterol desaturase/sphingolipid hydroxylase (fatty acid hydroxylase superfamily)